jgi:L,D-transpeptidase YcbB
MPVAPRRVSSATSRRRFAAVCLLATLCLADNAAARRRAPEQLSSAIRSTIETGRSIDPDMPSLDALYGPGSHAPLWVTPQGFPSPDAEQALSMLGAAARDGLDPEDYAAASLAQVARTLGPGATPTAVARFDVGLSAGTLRFLRDLHRGRIDARAIGFRMSAPADDHDYVALLRSTLSAHRIARAAEELAPPLVLYRGLRGMLARYRELAATSAAGLFRSQPAVVKPGEPYDESETLHAVLTTLGDLPAEQGAGPPRRYEGPLVDGVKRFQARHGLAPDGVLGKETHAALRVPLTWRVRQIELALERLRWLPHLSPERFLAVNIPMFHLWAWNTVPPSGAPRFGMEVIVGRAVSTRTPVFVAEMRHIIFRPYWNVPRSIARGEILPILERDAGYLGRHNMELVAGAEDVARVVTFGPEALAGLRRGSLRIRQRPGPSNALGLVKFVFPNEQDVYMHGTPATDLFSRTRRDFSHGCVRLADPVALAEWALEDQGWTRDAILAAMNGHIPRQVNLTRPIQVILFYVTAVVMPDDGTIWFASDIYGHDTRLDQALRHRPRPLRYT